MAKRPKVVEAPEGIPQQPKSVSQRLHELANQLQPVIHSTYLEREYALVPPHKLKEVRSGVHKIADELNHVQET